MKRKRNKRSSALPGYYQIPLILGLILVLIDILLLLTDLASGLVVALFLVVYFAAFFILYRSTREVMFRDRVTFAARYGEVQNRILKELPQPYALLGGDGRILWMNNAFEQVSHRDNRYHKSITTIFSQINRDAFPTAESPTAKIGIEHEGSSYQVQISRLNFGSGEEDDGKEVLLAVFLTDTTAVKLAVQEVDDQSLAVGFIYLDNYDEALESMEEVQKSLLVALIDRKVNKYVLACDGISAKTEKDKYLIVLRKKALGQMQEEHFGLLDEVKSVNIGNEMPITLSIGVGVNGLNYAQNYELARQAVDLALGRGGDQAVVKTNETTYFYGGKAQQVEKSTRVKARVKAQALKEIISARDTVFIMGHRLGDPDSFGSALGIYRIAISLGKTAYIVINEKTTSIRQLLTLFEHNDAYPDDFVIDSEKALALVTANSALVVVDVNRPSITECPELLKLCKSIVVLDHHRAGKETIEHATLSYVETYASSACELVSEILQYVGDNIHLRPEEADAMYGGILIDTNNFVTRTGVRTFEAAAFLRRCGADMVRVRKLLREDVKEYKAKAQAVSRAEVYRGVYAISICNAEGLRSPTIIGAQAANDMLDIKGVKAGFVLTDYKGKVFISARSLDEVNVQLIMEKLGGGGHQTVAGAQLEEVPIEEARNAVKRTIDEMVEDGELEE